MQYVLNEEKTEVSQNNNHISVTKHCLDMLISYSVADDCYSPLTLYNIPNNVYMQEVTLHDCEPAWLFWSALTLMFAEIFQLSAAKDKTKLRCASLL